MNGERFIQLRGRRVSGSILAGLAATVLLVNALAYVWLYLGQPFMFRIWGFTFLASGLAALPFVLWAFRINVHDLSGIREWIGRPRHWFAAVLIPLLIAGAAVGWEWMNTRHAPVPGWKWITYGSSALLDLPLVFVWTLPMLLLFELAFRRSFSLLPSNLGRTARGLASAFFWLLSCGIPVYYTAVNETIELAVSYSILALGLGFYSYRLQEGGAIVISALSVLLTATITLLLIGSLVPEVNTILFGYDVEVLPALWAKKSSIIEIFPGIMGVVLFLAAIPIAPKNSSN